MTTSWNGRFSRRAAQRNRLALGALLAAGVVASIAPGCADMPVVLTQLLEARRLAAELHVQFTKAADAANRAVMADSDEVSAAAAREARQAREVVELDAKRLESILRALGYTGDLRHLEGFKARFDEYRRLDDEILPLAVENTNLKAQRLSFGPAREAADAFRRSLEAVAGSVATADACRVRSISATAVAALLEIQIAHGPHIAESEDAAMTHLEKQMAASEAVAQRALEELKVAVPPGARARLSDAGAALDRFMAITREIVTLSRRNSNVRSLALSLGRKRMVTAQCDDHLRALEDALVKHGFTATR